MTMDQSMPRSLPTLPAVVLGALALVGAVAFAAGAASSDPELARRAMRVFLHNWLLWAALAQGALVLSCAFRLANASWPGPVHRMVDALGAYVPLSLLLFAVIYLGRRELFEWVEHPVHGKEWWFTSGFTFTRDLLALGWMTILSVAYLYLSVRPTLGEARDRAGGWQRGLVQRWTSGWRGELRERALAERRLRKLAAVLALSYALCYSLLAVDLVMSLAPHWVSTMFPAYFAWGGFLSSVALTSLLAVLMRDGPGLRGEITESRRHDLGKMLFAFSTFWMYLFWSQYLVIWYGNVPEETGFLQARLGTQFLMDTWYMGGFWQRLSEPYVWVTLWVWFLCWISPFWILLGQRPKKTPVILGGVALGSLGGFWLERYILVTPSLVTPEAVVAGASVTPFGWLEVSIGGGFAGLFFLCFLTFARVFPGTLPARSG
jgi:hypothetical protein